MSSFYSNSLLDPSPQLVELSRRKTGQADRRLRSWYSIQIYATTTVDGTCLRSRAEQKGGVHGGIRLFSKP